MKTTIFVLLALSLVARIAAGDEEEQKVNCKLTIKTTMKDGEKKVEVKEVHAGSKTECKKLADKELKSDDEDVSKISVSSSFRG